MNTQIVIKDASKLEGVRNVEHSFAHKQIQLMLQHGINAILTTGGMDDMAQKYLVESGVMGCRRVSYEDLKRIAKITGGTIVSTLADMDGNESYDPTNMGIACEVTEERIADTDYIFIRDGKDKKCGSIVVRGPNL